ncbi:MAG: hypothetical protein J6Q54_06665, partial [Oscillospiraceae bacterium]|nr:hypothetical protein [Oscillospiraceae bacterium]
MKRQRKKEYLRVRGDTGQHRRIVALGLTLGMLVFVVIIIRLYDLMVNQYDYYADQAARNQSRTTIVAADRGVIYDRNMNILAYSQTVDNIYLNPRELRQSGADMTAISHALGEILELDADWILQQSQDTRMRYKQIAAGLDNSVSAKIREYINQNGISGIHLEPSSKRLYPEGTLAAQLIGVTNASNDGSEGIEAAYDAYLSGDSGRVIATKGNNEIDMPFSYEKYLA